MTAQFEPRRSPPRPVPGGPATATAKFDPTIHASEACSCSALKGVGMACEACGNSTGSGRPTARPQAGPRRRLPTSTEMTEYGLLARRPTRQRGRPPIIIPPPQRDGPIADSGGPPIPEPLCNTFDVQESSFAPGAVQVESVGQFSIAGRVTLPLQDDQPVWGPLVIFLHGAVNGTVAPVTHAQVFVTLQDCFARAGFITASFRTQQDGGNLSIHQRAMVAMASMPFLHDYLASFFPDIDSLDLRSALIGWSRGGQSILELGELLLSAEWGAQVEALIAISPADEDAPFFLFSGRSYLSIHGGLDGDVATSGPALQYERVQDFKDYVGRILLSHGTHGGNTDWGPSSGTDATTLQVQDQWMPGSDQLAFVRAYTLAFLKWRMQAAGGLAPVFRANATFEIEDFQNPQGQNLRFCMQFQDQPSVSLYAIQHAFAFYHFDEVIGDPATDGSPLSQIATSAQSSLGFRLRWSAGEDPRMVLGIDHVESKNMNLFQDWHHLQIDVARKSPSVNLPLQLTVVLHNPSTPVGAVAYAQIPPAYDLAWTTDILSTIRLRISDFINQIGDIADTYMIVLIFDGAVDGDVLISNPRISFV